MAFLYLTLKKFSNYRTLSVTKRSILKILAMLFDSIGILQPLVINLKILFQKVCKEKFDWDEETSEE